MAAKKKVPEKKKVVKKKVAVPKIAKPDPPTVILPFKTSSVTVAPVVAVAHDEDTVVVHAPSWRKQRGNAVWHGNPQCADWPKSDYSEKLQRPAETHCEEEPCL